MYMESVSEDSVFQLGEEEAGADDDELRLGSMGVPGFKIGKMVIQSEGIYLRQFPPKNVCGVGEERGKRGRTRKKKQKGERKKKC